MVDEWVLASQKWVNATYGGKVGFVPAPETGFTGWGTMFALTRALQIELGVSPRSDTFGSLTLSTLTAKFPSISNSIANKNIVALVQCAMWCKGYWGGTVWKTLDSTTNADIARMRTDMGLTSGVTISPKMMKSMLTMDAYVLTSGGTALIASIQRSLNSRYLQRADFFIVPCDGRYSRDVQRGLIYAVQYELGIVDGTANGEVGPLTRSKLQVAAPSVKAGAVDTSGFLVHLFQAALIFNGYYLNGPYSGTFSSAVTTAVKAFQTFAALPVSGTGDYQTWCSLLVSTGDPERTAAQGAKAADCSLDYVTVARAQTLKSNGYSIVGRYLTNTPVKEFNNKRIQPGELATIAGAGLKVFPIFQEGGDSSDYFSFAAGLRSGRKAYTAARSYGFKKDTTIYFAVDFDALEEEVSTVVLPHFRGINQALVELGNYYKVGIYAARNTCRIVYEANLARLCFVSGLSTAYSGNLGFPLPPMWAFDQVKEYSIGSGDGAMNIDKNIVSGKDLGTASFETAPNFYDYLDFVYARAVSFKAANPTVQDTANDLTVQYLRYPQYATVAWKALAGEINANFVSYVESQGRERVQFTIAPEISTLMSVDHFAAAMHGARYYGVPQPLSLSTVGDFLGWSGDLTQVWVDYANSKNAGEEPDPYFFARSAIGRKGGFDSDDHQSDIDGFVIGMLSRGKSTSIATIVRNYYTASTGGYRTRYRQFLDVRYAGSYTTAFNAAYDWFTTTAPVNAGVRTAFLAWEENKFLGVTNVSELAAIAQAWADDLKDRVTGVL